MADKDVAADAPDGFLSRWARRKNQVRSGVDVAAVPPVPVPVPVPAVARAATPVPAFGSAAAPVAVAAEPVPVLVPAAAPPATLADVALLTRESDYSRFVAPGIDEGVKQAALKKLFSDPHFNVMDGLDTYIDDYGKPDPIPLAMLRQMNQSKFLRLFEDDEADAEADTDAEAETQGNAPAVELPALPVPSAIPAIPATAHATPPDDHSDLRLQQDDAAGPSGPAEGARA